MTFEGGLWLQVVDNFQKINYGVALYGGSSIGRVADSKSAGWGFDSLPPCQKTNI